MADNLGGFVEGALAGQQYAQSKALFGLSMQEGQQKLQEGSLSIQEKELAIQQTKKTIAQQEQMIQLMRGIGAGGARTPTDMAAAAADMSFAIGQAAIQSGRYEEGLTAVKDGSALLKNNAAIMLAGDKHQTRVLADVVDLASGVIDEASKNRALQMFPVLHPNEAKDPEVQKLLQNLQSKPYDKETWTRLRDAVTSQKDKVEMAARNAAALDSLAAAREHDVRVKDLIPAQTRAANARADAFVTVGAKALNPTPADIKAVMKLAEERFPDADPQDPTFYSLARPVAERARELHVKDHLSPSAAQDKAFAEAMQKKHFDGLLPKGHAPIGSFKNPMPTPKTAGEAVAGKVYVVKRSEQLPEGLGVWNGTGFERPVSVENPAGGDDADALLETLMKDSDE